VERVTGIASALYHNVEHSCAFRGHSHSVAYNLSDKAEYQVRDRFRSRGFLRLGIEDGTPDATTQCCSEI
jgi:hypothetical protein